MTLEEALEDAIASLMEPPRTIEGILAEFPNIGAIAQWYSGSPKRSGSAYRAARRRFERYAAQPPKERRRPSARFIQELRDRLRRRRRRFQKRGARVKIRGRVRVSRDERDRTIRTTLSPEAMNEVLDLFDDDGIEAAADRFAELIGDENLGGQLPTWTAVHELTITPGAAQ